jgi:hypothetical protein
MVAVLVLVTGVTVILVVGAIGLAWIGMGNILPSLVPLAPWLVMLGTLLLSLTELLLFLGNKEDRKTAVRDLGYLVPTCLLSAALWYGLQHYLW